VKIFSLGCLALGLVAALLPASEPGDPYVLVLSGDTDGYLSPCGCTKPMSGGIRRRADAVKRLGPEGRTVFIENGGFVAASGRQDELKAEALAESLRLSDVSAINLGPTEAKLGRGLVLSLQRLSGGAFVSGSLRPSPTNEVQPFTHRGPFLIGGISQDADLIAGVLQEASQSHDQAIQSLLDHARLAGLVPVLMVQGPKSLAADLARRHPGLRLVQYRSSGDPPTEPERVGNTLLVTPGENAKHVVRLVYRNGNFEGYLPVRLGPEYHDDPHASRVYTRYQDRVRAEKLLDRLPRVQTAAFAGTEKCGSCHEDAYKTWKESSHAKALLTLEEDNHDADPDCVGCHVVALESTEGFKSRLLTPHLTDVGCESCHGPGLAHALSPKEHALPANAPKSCASCHTPATSPNFDYERYWQQIVHK
jgi:hypothetical protein